MYGQRSYNVSRTLKSVSAKHVGLFLYQQPSSDLTFSPSSGVITANRTEQNINSVLTYTGDKKFFIMNVSVADAYNDFTYSENFTMKCS